MSKASPIQSSMNSGELSNLLNARVDFAKYSTGASIMENFLPTSIIGGRDAIAQRAEILVSKSASCSTSAQVY